MMIDQGARLHVADHLERGRVDAGEERDEVIEQADLRLVEEGPEIADHRRRQHHRQEDQRGPEAVAAEALVDQVGEAEADQGLDGDGPQDEMRRHLHVVPDVGIGQHALVVAQAHPQHRLVRPVGAEVREGEPDRPDQREDVDREQQGDRRRDEQPGDRPVRQAAHAAGEGRRGREGRPLGQSGHAAGFGHPLECRSGLRVRRQLPGRKGGSRPGRRERAMPG